MRILVACESSGRVRDAFIAKGHDAVSCDIQDTEVPGPHIRGNVLDHRIIKMGWDMLLAFPDCTYLTVSGAKHMSIHWRQEAMLWALAFVKTLWALPIKRKCLENPVGRLSTLWMKPTQIVHPWMFGTGETKATCLWLDGLPKLQATNVVDGRVPRVHLEPPGPDRQRNRSRTDPNMAFAFAAQWS